MERESESESESIKFKEEFEGNCIQTLRDVKTDQEALNAKLLTQAGFVKQELAGVYTYTRLGYEVLRNIEDVVRANMQKIGNEVLMPTLQPTENWALTGRLDTVSSLFEARGANELPRKNNPSRYVLGPTHEEIVAPLAKRYIKSYRDFPVSFFQFQMKFRNETRPKSGLLRGREFLMKDLYSFHPDLEDFKEFYEHAKEVYHDIFYELGIGDDTFITLALGGDFTKEFSHEFQTLLPLGEDTIYLDRENRIAYNKEIINEENEKRLGVKFDELEEVTASEVGNIFPLSTKFSEPFNLTYTDKDGKSQPIYMGCYGIGVSRLMGVIAEKFADDKGLVWPENIAPAKYHIVTIAKNESDESYKTSKELFALIGSDALWDKRPRTTTGEKLNDADLIGCPYRIVVSPKSLEKGGVEIKSRIEDEGEVVSIGNLIDKFGGPRKV